MDSIWLPSNAFAPAEIYGREAIPLFYESAAVNPYDGQVVKLRRVSDQPALELMTTSMYPLHFGDFVGIGLKVVYFTFPPSAALARMTSGEGGLGAGAPVTVQAGPYALRLVEFATDAPLDAGVAGQRKVFRLALCQGCGDRIRAVHIRLGKPRSLPPAGTL